MIKNIIQLFTGYTADKVSIVAANKLGDLELGVMQELGSFLVCKSASFGDSAEKLAHDEIVSKAKKTGASHAVIYHIDDRTDVSVIFGPVGTYSAAVTLYGYNDTNYQPMLPGYGVHQY